MGGMARYRLRTRIRSHLPWALTWLAPKGLRDCGDHDWYREDEHTARCYHCEPGKFDLPPGSDILPGGAIVTIGHDTSKFPGPEAIVPGPQ